MVQGTVLSNRNVANFRITTTTQNNAYILVFSSILYLCFMRLPLLREKFRLPKILLHSDLRRRAASGRALPRPSSIFVFRYF